MPYRQSDYHEMKDKIHYRHASNVVVFPWGEATK